VKNINEQLDLLLPDSAVSESKLQDPADLENLAEKHLQKLGLDSLAEKLEIIWNPRMRSTAGKAHWPSAKIELNPLLQKISQEEIERTFLHELAHLLAYHRHGVKNIRAHGSEWQQACEDLGIPGEAVTHKLPLPRRQLRRRWRYRCPHCHHQFKRVRKYSVKVACYRCCLKNNNGRYHPMFHLVEEPLDS